MELWIRLRRLQSHPAHFPHRPLLHLLLEEVGEDGGWSNLLRAAAHRDSPIAELDRTAPEPLAVIEREARELAQRGVHLLTPADARYPESLRRSADPPLTLTVLGDLEAFARPGLAVVGSREPTRESLSWMETELGSFCRQTRAAIVSGGARGVDQKAHSIAIRNDVPTIVFLPSGIERPYPADIGRWFAPVLKTGGAIVSEYPAFTPMDKVNFHQRNRLIAAAGRMTLIVEAKLRSGTLITATRAAEIGRPLLTIPAHPTNPNFGGNLHLLAQGATALAQNEDLTLFWQAEVLSFEATQLSVADGRCDGP